MLCGLPTFTNGEFTYDVKGSYSYVFERDLINLYKYALLFHKYAEISVIQCPNLLKSHRFESRLPLLVRRIVSNSAHLLG